MNNLGKKRKYSDIINVNDIESISKKRRKSNNIMILDEEYQDRPIKKQSRRPTRRRKNTKKVKKNTNGHKKKNIIDDNIIDVSIENQYNYYNQLNDEDVYNFFSGYEKEWNKLYLEIRKKFESYKQGNFIEHEEGWDDIDLSNKENFDLYEEFCKEKREVVDQYDSLISKMIMSKERTNVVFRQMGNGQVTIDCKVQIKKKQSHKNETYDQRKNKKKTTRTSNAKKNYEEKTVKFKGLTKTLANTFYPDGNPFFSNIESRRTERFLINKQNKRGRCSSYGKQHGDTVHKQVEMITNILLNGEDIKMFLHKQKIDNCVILLFDFFQKENILPLFPETPIYDEHLAIATQIDMIALTKECHIKFIEVKTGYECGSFSNNFDDDLKLSSPLSDYYDTPYHRASLQLSTTLDMVSQRYNYCPQEASIVLIQPKTKNVYQYSLPKWLNDPDCRFLIYASLFKNSSKENRKRIKNGQKIRNNK